MSTTTDYTGQSQAAANAQAQYVTPGDLGNVNNPATTSGGAQPVNTGVDVAGTISINVGGKLITLTMNNQVDPAMSSGDLLSPAQRKRLGGDADAVMTVQDKLKDMQTWYSNTTKRQQIIDQMYSAGLLTTKKNPSVYQVAFAWSVLVQEAALEGASGTNTTAEDILAKAATGGWNSIQAQLNPADEGVIATGNLNNAADTSTTSSQTIYKSYLDPATVMGAQADAWFRLMGRNPTPGEYQAFLNTVFTYQDASNTGKFETKSTDPSDKVKTDPQTGQPVGPQGTSTNGTDPTVQTNTVSQRGVGTRGLQFLAGQAALANPEEGPYQAATTYLNALIKGLSGPAAGMQASGPTTTIP